MNRSTSDLAAVRGFGQSDTTSHVQTGIHASATAAMKTICTRPPKSSLSGTNQNAQPNQDPTALMNPMK